MKKTLYLLHWDFGFHHHFVEVSKDDFFTVINDMSEEFEIVKDDTKAGLQYMITDYQGYQHVLGYINNGGDSDE